MGAHSASPEESTGVGRIVVATVVMVAAVTCAIAMALSSSRFMGELALPRPPLASIRPVITHEPTPRITRRVFLQSGRDPTTCQKRLAAAAIMTSALALAIALGPAAYIWIEFPCPNASLPGPMWLATIPALQFTVACVAIHASMVLGMEGAWYVARRAGA